MDAIHQAMENEDFAEAAFLYEMDGHEYAINLYGDRDVLSCFNLNFAKLVETGLDKAWYRARMKHMEMWGII